MKTLYKIPLSEQAQTGEGDSRGSQLAESGILQGNKADVAQLSSEAADLSLEGQFRFGKWHAKLHAEELEELASSSIGALPLFRPDDRFAGAGYYEIESADVGPAHPNAPDSHTWSLELKAHGTKHDYDRAIELNPYQTDIEAFGNDLGTEIGIPTSARKVRWLNTETDAREIAEPTATREADLGEIDVYDPADASWYEPPDATADGEDSVTALLYHVDYGDEAPTDCRVYDTLGADDKFLANADGRVRVWESVFSTGHDAEDELILDNGLVRLRLDERAGMLEAERWDPDAAGTVDGSGQYSDDVYGAGSYGGARGSWVTVGLEDDQPSSVELFDVNLTSIAMVRDVVELTFAVDDDLVTLEAILTAGHDDVLFDFGPSETGPLEQDLADWLEPIASTSIVDPQAEKTLVSR